MGVLKNCKNFVSDCWNTDIKKEDFLDIKQLLAFGMIILVMFFFAFLFFFHAYILIIVLKYAFLHIQKGYVFLEVNEVTWLAIGLIFGMALSMIVQSLPKSHGQPETPKIIWESFGHHFAYFLGIATCIMIWIGIFRVFGVF